MTNLEKWRFYLKDIESPDVFINWSFYALVSIVLQRRVWLYPDPFSLFPNLFMTLVGPPAAGKSRVIAFVKDILDQRKLAYRGKNDKVYSMFPYAPDALTWQRIPDMFLENTQAARTIIDGKVENFKVESFDEKGERKLKNYLHASTAFLSEELSVLLNEENRQVVPILNQIYDARVLHYSSKSSFKASEGRERVNNVCSTILAGTYPEFFVAKTVDQLIKTGLSSRMLFIYSEKPRFDRIFPGVCPEQEKAREDLIDHFAALYYVNGEVSLSPEAEEFYKKVYESGDLREKRVNKDKRLENYYGRKRVNWLKLSVVLHFAHFDGSMVVKKHSLENALSELTAIEPMMHNTFMNSARNGIYDASMNMLSVIRNNPQGIAWKKLWWICGSDGTKAELYEARDFLEYTKKIKASGDLYFPVDDQGLE